MNTIDHDNTTATLRRLFADHGLTNLTDSEILEIGIPYARIDDREFADQWAIEMAHTCHHRNELTAALPDDDLPPPEGFTHDGWMLRVGELAIERVWSHEIDTGTQVGVWAEIVDVFTGSGPISRGHAAVGVNGAGEPLDVEQAARVAAALTRAAELVSR